MTESLAPPLPPTNASDDEFLLAFLDSHESECPACGYNCHKVQTPRCPECGIALALRLVSLDPMRKSWAFAMIGASLAAGVGSLLLLLIAQHGWPRVSDPVRECIYMIQFTYFIGMVPGAALLLILRRGFERLSRPMRMTIAAVLLMVTIVMFVWLAWVG